MSEQPKKPTKKKVELDPRFVDYRHVWVCIESERGVVHPVSWELLGEGRKLADALGVELYGVVICGPGERGKEICGEAFQHGADKAYLLQHEILRDYRNEPYTKALTDLVNSYQPEILMLGATTLGRDLAGSVATTLGTGLVADCTELVIDTETRNLASTRPTFGGSLLCTILTQRHRPQMATVRPRVMAMPEPDASRSGEIIEVPFSMIETDIITKVLEFIPDDTRDKPNLPFADIIVAGGRGLRNQENFQLVWDLAKVLGAEVGASRPIVQAGWAELDRQVGQSGKTVRPKLYIAAGISGAIQHRVGMDGADVIIAINTDPNAPIFDFAHYGIVGNAITVLPALTEAFKARLGQLKKAG
ncbi:electron transfer flavoprotein, alpha subunit, FixB [Azotobacter vinelandii CA]|uniref:Electron transfer flavoprotein, alpha subunit, FixB n=2 Tax=Azotobacter vinelandii TaxID=354 RepID=C1DNR8_AZOVD|nr:electron transfer flavoprotein subunit alpha/FixB family protein [Azotobacter vinelandii]ACO77284.1 electron transfer flavoprotein, alpha subunit, FixB [Azotobacter vinelandii DJ]AGK13466.1 electron transfer flavoprotein, alpha subunit, FixB [Azotobacter vinelandii CA]AGK17876.1 electron transfer flavoprotein, alpha subunit, FixB [Azotobacter vinelandii CA6]WKN22962.1 electron transfer flavoprotein subunit alpha/FixB family protein [Azotobacter vinelandii]SFX62747.1 electron transfer flavop